MGRGESSRRRGHRKKEMPETWCCLNREPNKMCAFLLVSFYISQNKRHAHFWWVKRPGELSVQNLVDPAGFHEHKEPAMFVFGETWDTLPNPKKGRCSSSCFSLGTRRRCVALSEQWQTQEYTHRHGKTGHPGKWGAFFFDTKPRGQGHHLPSE